MKILYFDCFNGAAGDMLLGAFLDLGLPLDELRAALGSLGIRDYELTAERVLRAGISATKFRLIEKALVASGASSQPAERHYVNEPLGPHSHAGGHPHRDARGAGAHPHRSLEEIEHLIDHAALSPSGKGRAKMLFRRLAEVEASIHGMPVERVYLHEVGALDSIIDIVGTVFAFEWARADRVVVSPMNVGAGMVQTAHGTFPVPAPATLRLVSDTPVFSAGPSAELLTPTGALLLTGFASAYGPMPAMQVKGIGYGAGDRDFTETPNVLRVVVGESIDAVTTERIVVLECEIDDMNPQIFGPLMDRLYAAGALDVFYSAVQMKKSRPGTLVTVLAPPDRRDELAGIVFRETTTIGVRYHEMARERLHREVISIDSPLGPIRFKVARREGRVVNASPEFDDCARIAAERHLAVKDVQAIATKAWLDHHAPHRVP
jgi:uncharacterized protein (TIGR00299 family) protein